MTETLIPQLKTYRAAFRGVVLGALGCSSSFVKEVTAKDEEAARLELYKTHEHIYQLVLTEKGRGYPLAYVPESDYLSQCRVACHHEGCEEAVTYFEAQRSGWVLNTTDDRNAYYCAAHSH